MKNYQKNNVHIGQCVFCGEKDIPVVAAVFAEEYCLNCFNMMIEDAKEARSLIFKFIGKKWDERMKGDYSE